MRMRKEIRVYTSHLDHNDWSDATSWADVWMSWKDSRRRKQYLAPCINSAKGAYSDLWMSVECRLRNPDMASVFDADIQRGSEAVEAIEGGAWHIEDGAHGMPEIYSPAPEINRREAERMMALVLERSGIRNPKFRWDRPKHRVYAT